VASAVAGSYGTITINSDGSYSYIVDNSNAEVEALRNSGQTLDDVFTYTVSDAAGATSSTQITVTIEGKNDAPVATGDHYSINAGETLSLASPGVLSNDTDVDGDSVQMNLVSGPSHGVLS